MTARFSEEVRRAAVERALLPLREGGVRFAPKTLPVRGMAAFGTDLDGLHVEVLVNATDFGLSIRDGLSTVLHVEDTADGTFRAELFEAVHGFGPVTGDFATVLLHWIWKDALAAGGKPFVSTRPVAPGAFQMIRLAAGYELAIAVQPAWAKPDDPGLTFHRWASWEIGGEPAYAWNTVSRDAAMAYFGGMGSGLGHEVLPASAFASLAEAGAYMLTGFTGSRQAMLARIDEADAVDP